MTSLTIVSDFTRDFHHSLPIEIPNFDKRIRVTSDIEKFRWKEDESVWRQKRGLSALSYEVLFDGEFVCFFDLNDSMEQAVLRALEGLRDLFVKKKVFVNESMYQVIKAEREAKEKEKLASIPKAANLVEEIIVKNLKTKRRKKNAKLTA